MRGWVLPLCHQVSVILAPALGVEPPPPLLLLVLVVPLLLHAAIPSAAATATAMMAGFLEPRMGSSPDDAGGLLIAGTADGAGLLYAESSGRASRTTSGRVASETLDKFSEVPLS
jgi:hypothetical protein